MVQRIDTAMWELLSVLNLGDPRTTSRQIATTLLLAFQPSSLLFPTRECQPQSSAISPTVCIPQTSFLPAPPSSNKKTALDFKRLAVKSRACTSQELQRAERENRKPWPLAKLPRTARVLCLQPWILSAFPGIWTSVNTMEATPCLLQSSLCMEQ